MKYIFLFLFFQFTTFSVFSQLSGIGISYLNSTKTPISTEFNNVRDNGISLNFDKYLHRFWSTSVFISYANGTFNNQINDPGFGLMSDSYNNFSSGININYWFLNDLRLLGQRSRNSCKGKMVALNYKFKSFLSAGINGEYYKTLNQSELLLFNYSLGIGFNLWQFSISNQPNVVRVHTKYLLIPFFRADYHNAINKIELFNIHEWKPKSIVLKIGLKIGINI